MVTADPFCAQANLSPAERVVLAGVHHMFVDSISNDQAAAVLAADAFWIRPDGTDSRDD